MPAPRTTPVADQPLLLRHVAGGIATLTLNRPEARNALSVALMREMQDALDSLRADTAVKVVIIAGNGPVFCSGHDLKEMRAEPKRAAYEALFAQCSRLMQSIVHLPQPVIARVQGIATAAGCQLVASCDLAVAAMEARFATPGVNLGLFCSTPMVALTRNVGRKQAMAMLLTGDMIDTKHAVEIGLINRAVPASELDAAVQALATKITSKSPLTVKIGKEAFYRQAEMNLGDAYAYAGEVMVRNMLARDAEEGIDAFLEKREPEWQGR